MTGKWNRTIRVLATDDSQVMRSMFHALFKPGVKHDFKDLPETELCGVARNGAVGAPCVVAIGVSTGGPLALEQMLPRLPAGFAAPVLIVQHMPKAFVSSLAQRLDRSCGLVVREAYEGAAVKPGTVWIAPGDMHMEVAKANDGWGSVIHLRHGDAFSSYCPAVNNLFTSTAGRYGAGALALVMTGMGSDGLAGAQAVYKAGGTVLVQDEATSAVWGMPGRVAAEGIAARILPLGSIAAELVRRVGETGGTRLPTPASRDVRVAKEKNELL